MADDAAGAGVGAGADFGAGGALAVVFAAGAGEAEGFVEGDSAAAEADAPPEDSSFFFLVDDFADEDLSVAAVADALSEAESALELLLEDFFAEVDPFAAAVESAELADVSVLFLEDDFFVFVEAASSPEGAEVSVAPASLFFFFDDFDFDVPDEAVESSDTLASDFLDFFDFFVDEVDDWSLAEPVWDCAQTKEENASSKYTETKAAKRAALFFIRSS